MDRHRGERGSATLLAIFLSAIIITLGIGFNWLVKEHLKAADGLRLKTEAMLDVYSTFDSSLFFLATAQKSAGAYLNANQALLGITELPANGEFTALQKGLKVRVSDANGLVSMMNIGPDTLRTLIRNVTGSDGNEITDSYFDWIDGDDLVRLKGAEEAFYRELGLAYKPRNYSIQYKEELALVRGMDPSLYRTIEPLITMLPAGSFNPNTAQKALLKASFGVDDEAAAAISKQFATKPVTSGAEMAAVAGKHPAWVTGEITFSLSPFFELTVASGDPEAIYRISAGVGLVATGDAPFSFYFWREG